MIPLAALHPGGPRRVLCLGAHSDDIEIGCGGTVLTLVEGTPGLEVVWVVFSAPGDRREEAERSARRFLEGAASARVVVHEFRESFFPWEGREIKEAFEDLGASFVPDLVLTHHRADRHQDHRTIAELTWNTFRDQLVLEYEIPKFEGDLGTPNFYIPVREELARRKVEALLQGFPSQRGRDWFRPEVFLGLMSVRGIECRAPSGFAEAMHAPKLRFAGFSAAT